MKSMLTNLVRELESQISECKAFQGVQAEDFAVPASGVITIRTDCDDYVRDLEGLRQVILNPARSGAASETEGSVPPLPAQPLLWKVLTFCRPFSRFIDPHHLRERLQAFLKVSGGVNPSADSGSWTQDIWETPVIERWVSSDQPLMVFVEPLHTAAPRARYFALELITHLEKHHPVACMLGGLPPSVTNELLPDLTPEVVLEQLIGQLLRSTTLSRPLPFILDNIRTFREASDCKDWFELLQKVCERIPQVSIVLDLALIPLDSQDAIRSWPAELHRISKELSQSSPPTLLNVLLVGPRRLFAGHRALGLAVSVGDSPEPGLSFLPMGLRKRDKPCPPEVPKIAAPLQTSWLPDIPHSIENPGRPGEATCTGLPPPDNETHRNLITVPIHLLEEISPSATVNSKVATSEGVHIRSTPPTLAAPKPCEQETPSKKRPAVPADLRAELEGPPKSRHDIKIALVCALTLEADAIYALFDEQWRIKGHMWAKMKLEGDINNYSFGIIGGHPAVVVYMPGMGKSHSAMVAANCRNSFPNLKLALVVGICGGVPFYEGGTREITLGDVIVSEGLKQVDFGRQYPDKFMMRQSVADVFGRPPPQIRGLINRLKSRHDGQNLRERMTEHLQTLRRVLGKEAEYPGAGKDQCFEGSYTHQHNDPNICGTCTRLDVSGYNEVCDQARESSCEDLRCDEGKLVPRKRLEAIVGGPGQSDTFPAVHFGYIACADHVMKSGEDRDSIAKNTGVIAFEMEGAGVWDMFPCLVIKAVCDYADSHKNKKWQRYAAGTAAACAKAFLEEWYM